MYKYFIEFLGVIVILFASLLTEGNPYVMGICYFSVYMIGRNVEMGHFNPLSVFSQYSLGRMSLKESVYYLTAQYLAAGCIILTFMPIKTFMRGL
jgi:glycerol uptake facilitator-like aquaporin